MKNFEYIYPRNAESIPALLSESEGKCLLFAGGTDALMRLKEGIDSPEKLINLKAVKSLNFIREQVDGLHLGATTKLSDLVKSPAVKKYTGLSEAVQSVGTIQLRNMGTVGGNLCQRPRCWYFRSRNFHCLRKHGDTCFAIYGENKYHAILGGNPCYIVHPSDLAPMLIALDAKVEIRAGKKSRLMDLADFYVLPEQNPNQETVLSPRELLTKAIVPISGAKSHYLKFRERQSFDFATVSVAIAATVSGNRLENVRIVYGGVAPKPWRARQAEAVLNGAEATEAKVASAAEAELAAAEPLEQNAYKVILAKNLLWRTVRELLAV